MSTYTVSISGASGTVGNDSTQTYTVMISATGSGLTSGLLVQIAQSGGSTNTWSGTLQAQDSSGNWPAEMTFNGSAATAALAEPMLNAISTLCTIYMTTNANPGTPVSPTADVYLMVSDSSST